MSLNQKLQTIYLEISQLSIKFVSFDYNQISSKTYVHIFSKILWNHFLRNALPASEKLTSLDAIASEDLPIVLFRNSKGTILNIDIFKKHMYVTIYFKAFLHPSELQSLLLQNKKKLCTPGPSFKLLQHAVQWTVSFVNTSPLITEPAARGSENI